MNEVLRRKLFRTVLADSRSPTGILASSPEMVETVQRRQSGGLQRGGGSIASNVSPRRVIAGQQFNRLTGGLPERQPESYLQVLERIKNLPFNQQAQELTKAGFGATIGPNIPNFLSQTADTAKQVIGADIEDTKQMLGNLLGPDADKSIREALTKGVRSLKYATGLAGVGEEGGLGNEPTAGVGKTRAQLLEEEDSAAQDIAGSPVMGANRPAVDDDLEAGMAGDVPVTEAETLEQSKVSGANTGAKPPSTTDNSITQKIQQNLEDLQAGKTTSKKISQADAQNPKTIESFADQYKDYAEPEDIDLAKIEEDAKKAIGFDPEKASEDKQNAFWMNITRAGLAIAAGESDNALTNIAKGLSFGLNAYGKDVATLNEQQRADAKELRQLRYTMIKDAKSEAITTAANINAYRAQMRSFDQQERQFGITTELARERDAANKAVALSTLENSMLASLNTAKYQIKSLDIKQQEALVNESYKKMALIPDSLKAAVFSGYMDEEGNVTDLGREKGLENLTTTVILAEIAKGSDKTKTETDTQRANDGLAKVLSGDYSLADIAAAANNPLFKTIFEETGGDVKQTIKEINQSLQEEQRGRANTDANSDPLGLD